MRILRYILTLGLLLAISSCSSSLDRKISIVSLDNLDIKGLSAVKADIGFRNQSSRNIELQNVSITIKQKGRGLATLSLKEPIVVPRRSDLVEVSTLWRMHNVDMLNTLSVSGKILSGKAEGFTVDLVADVKLGRVKRSVELNNMLLSELIKTIDLNTTK